MLGLLLLTPVHAQDPCNGECNAWREGDPVHDGCLVSDDVQVLPCDGPCPTVWERMGEAYWEIERCGTGFRAVKNQVESLTEEYFAHDGRRVAVVSVCNGMCTPICCGCGGPPAYTFIWGGVPACAEPPYDEQNPAFERGPERVCGCQGATAPTHPPWRWLARRR